MFNIAVMSLTSAVAITPRSLPKEKIIEGIDPALAKLPPAAGNRARVQIAEVL